MSHRNVAFFFVVTAFIAGACPSATGFEEAESDANPVVFSSSPCEYPGIAKAREIGGCVRIQISVGPNGKPRDARVVQSANPALDKEVLKSARACQFSPEFSKGPGGKDMLEFEACFCSKRIEIGSVARDSLSQIVKRQLSGNERIVDIGQYVVEDAKIGDRCTPHFEIYARTRYKSSPDTAIQGKWYFWDEGDGNMMLSSSGTWGR